MATYNLRSKKGNKRAGEGLSASAVAATARENAAAGRGMAQVGVLHNRRNSIDHSTSLYDAHGAASTVEARGSRGSHVHTEYAAKTEPISTASPSPDNMSVDSGDWDLQLPDGDWEVKPVTTPKHAKGEVELHIPGGLFASLYAQPVKHVGLGVTTFDARVLGSKRKVIPFDRIQLSAGILKKANLTTDEAVGDAWGYHPYLVEIDWMGERVLALRLRKPGTWQLSNSFVKVKTLGNCTGYGEVEDGYSSAEETLAQVLLGKGARNLVRYLHGRMPLGEGGEAPLQGVGEKEETSKPRRHRPWIAAYVADMGGEPSEPRAEGHGGGQSVVKPENMVRSKLCGGCAHHHTTCKEAVAQGDQYAIAHPFDYIAQQVSDCGRMKSQLVELCNEVIRRAGDLGDSAGVALTWGNALVAQRNHCLEQLRTCGLVTEVLSTGDPVKVGDQILREYITEAAVGSLDILLYSETMRNIRDATRRILDQAINRRLALNSVISAEETKQEVRLCIAWMAKSATLLPGWESLFFRKRCLRRYKPGEGCFVCPRLLTLRLPHPRDSHEPDIPDYSLPPLLVPSNLEKLERAGYLPEHMYMDVRHFMDPLRMAGQPGYDFGRLVSLMRFAGLNSVPPIPPIYVQSQKDKVLDVKWQAQEAEALAHRSKDDWLIKVAGPDGMEKALTPGRSKAPQDAAGDPVDCGRVSGGLDACDGDYVERSYTVATAFNLVPSEDEIDSDSTPPPLRTPITTPNPTPPRDTKPMHALEQGANTSSTRHAPPSPIDTSTPRQDSSTHEPSVDKKGWHRDMVEHAYSGGKVGGRTLCGVGTESGSGGDIKDEPRVSAFSYRAWAKDDECLYPSPTQKTKSGTFSYRDWARVDECLYPSPTHTPTHRTLTHEDRVKFNECHFPQPSPDPCINEWATPSARQNSGNSTLGGYSGGGSMVTFDTLSNASTVQPYSQSLTLAAGGLHASDYDFGWGALPRLGALTGSDPVGQGDAMDISTHGPSETPMQANAGASTSGDLGPTCHTAHQPIEVPRRNQEQVSGGINELSSAKGGTVVGSSSQDQPIPSGGHAAPLRDVPPRAEGGIQNRSWEGEVPWRRGADPTNAGKAGNSQCLCSDVPLNSQSPLAPADSERVIMSSNNTPSIHSSHTGGGISGVTRTSKNTSFMELDAEATDDVCHFEEGDMQKIERIKKLPWPAISVNSGMVRTQLSHLELRMRMMHYNSEGVKAMVLLHLLDKEVKDKLLVTSNDGEVASAESLPYSGLKALILAKYDNEAKKVLAFAKFDDLAMQTRESPEEFATHLTQAAIACGKAYTLNLAHEFLRRLPANLRIEVLKVKGVHTMPLSQVAEEATRIWAAERSGAEDLRGRSLRRDIAGERGRTGSPRVATVEGRPGTPEGSLSRSPTITEATTQVMVGRVLSPSEVQRLQPLAQGRAVDSLGRACTLCYACHNYFLGALPDLSFHRPYCSNPSAITNLQGLNRGQTPQQGRGNTGRRRGQRFATRTGGTTPTSTVAGGGTGGGAGGGAEGGGGRRNTWTGRLTTGNEERLGVLITQVERLVETLGSAVQGSQSIGASITDKVQRGTVLDIPESTRSAQMLVKGANSSVQPLVDLAMQHNSVVENRCASVHKQVANEHNSEEAKSSTSNDPVQAPCVKAPVTEHQSLDQGPYTHVDLFCGIGGFTEGLKNAARSHVLFSTILAVDFCQKVALAYQGLHPESKVLAADISSALVRDALLCVHPDFVTLGSPCNDFSTEGPRLEGEAAAALVTAVELCVHSQINVFLIENVPQMLSSVAWGKALNILINHAYDVCIVKVRGTQVGLACRRTRVYVLVTKATLDLREAVCAYCALLNMTVPKVGACTVREVLRCSENVFYLKPRNTVRHAGVFTTDGVLPSPVRRHPGKPVGYPRRSSEGGRESVKVLSLSDVATLLSFHRRLPRASDNNLRLWLANLAMPAVVEALAVCMVKAGVLDAGRKAPRAQDLISEGIIGRVVIHKFNDPLPGNFYSLLRKAREVNLSSSPELFKENNTTDDERDMSIVIDEGLSASTLTTESKQDSISKQASMDTTSTEHDDSVANQYETAGRRVMWLDETSSDSEIDSGNDTVMVGIQPTHPPTVHVAAYTKPHCAEWRENHTVADEESYGDHSTVDPPRDYARIPRKQVMALVKLRARGRMTTVPFLLDTGAEVSLVSIQTVNKLLRTQGVNNAPLTECALRKGEFSQLILADGASRLCVRGAITLWVEFGHIMLRHRFLIIDMPMTAILGGDFFGMHGSELRYGDMMFAPVGSDTTVAMTERGTPAMNVQRLYGVHGIQRCISTQHGLTDDMIPTSVPVRASVAITVPPYTSVMIEAFCDQRKPCVIQYDAMFIPGAKIGAKMARYGLVLTHSLVTITAAGVVFTRAMNVTSEPTHIPQGTFLGKIVPLTDHWHIMTVDTFHPNAPCTSNKDTHYGNTNFPSIASIQDASSTENNTTSSESNVTRTMTVTDEQLRALLCTKDGTLVPALCGNTTDGSPLENLALAMLKSRRCAFAADPKNPSVTHLAQFGIDTGDASPQADKARRWAQKETEFILNHVQGLLHKGQITPSSSPWACNPVLARQGDKIRFCIDYRKLNSVTKRDSHGLGNIDDMLLKLNGACILSSIDLASGYYQVPLTAEAAPKTAFRVPTGALYQWKVAPFGLVNLPAQFTRLMHRVLGDSLGSHAMVYVDDILIFSKNAEEHILHLDDVLRRIQEAGLSCAIHKTYMFKTELKFLGHIVGAAGTRPDPDKVKAMADLAPPVKHGKVNLGMVMAANGLFNYYRRYIKDFSKIAAPITDLLKNNADMVWTSERQQAFDALKTAMCAAGMLTHPDFSRPFVLQTDASQVAVAGVLTQYHPLADTSAGNMIPNGREVTGKTKVVDGVLMKEVVIGFFSKLNSVQDAKMHAGELECLAVVLALNHFRPYVWGRPVTVVTDAKALKWLMTLQDNNGKLLRWALRLQEYDITVQHRPGTQNANADGLSRLPQLNELAAPQPFDHADEQWPDALGEMDAPPSGVRFADVQTSAPRLCSNAAHMTSAILPRLFTLRGATVREAHGTPHKLNTWVTMHGSSLGNTMASADKATWSTAMTSHDITRSHEQQVAANTYKRIAERTRSYGDPMAETYGSPSIMGELLQDYASCSDSEPTVMKNDKSDPSISQYQAFGQPLQQNTDSSSESSIDLRCYSMSSDEETEADPSTQMLLQCGDIMQTMQDTQATEGSGQKEESASKAKGGLDLGETEDTLLDSADDDTQGTGGKGKAIAKSVTFAAAETSNRPSQLAGRKRKINEETRSILKLRDSGKQVVNADRIPPVYKHDDDHCPSQIFGPVSLTRANLIQLQQTDVFCQQVASFLQGKPPPANSELAMEMALTGDQYLLEEDGLLCKMLPSSGKGEVLLRKVVPQALRPLVLRLGHDDGSAMHGGIRATYSRLADRYFWPGMATDVRTYVLGCPTCQHFKAGRTSKTALQAVRPPKLFQRIQIDLWAPGVKSARGHSYVLVAVDAMSNYPFLYACKTKTPEEIATHLFDIVLDIGAVEEFLSDNGGEFVGEAVKHLCKALKIHKLETSSYRPQCNGKTERLNQRIAAALRSWVNSRRDNWDEGLKVLAFALRTTPRADTGLTPFFIAFGREAGMLYDILMSDQSERGANLSWDIEMRMRMMATARLAVQSAFDIREKRNTVNNAGLPRTLQFDVGDYVLVRMEPEEGEPKKMEPRFSGPWQLVQRAGGGGTTFVCKMLGRDLKFTTVHVSRMKRYHTRPAGMDSPMDNPQVLNTTNASATLTAANDIDRLVDRCVDQASTGWLYKARLRDGTLSGWLTEEDMLERLGLTAAILDNFHALYELRHKDTMPAYALRRGLRKPATMTQAQALLLFPCGTRLALYTTAPNGKSSVHLGTVTGYHSPYYRIKYDNDTVGQMTKTLLQKAVLYYQDIQERKQQKSGGTAIKTRTQDTAVPRNVDIQDQDADVLRTSSSMSPSKTIIPIEPPTDFGPRYIGLPVYVMFSTGFCKGILGQYIKRAKNWTFQIRFDGEPLPRQLWLKPSAYSIATDAPEGSWYLALPEDFHLTLETGEGRAPSPPQSPSAARLKRSSDRAGGFKRGDWVRIKSAVWFDTDYEEPELEGLVVWVDSKERLHIACPACFDMDDADLYNHIREFGQQYTGRTNKAWKEFHDGTVLLLYNDPNVLGKAARQPWDLTVTKGSLRK